MRHPVLLSWLQPRKSNWSIINNDSHQKLLCSISLFLYDFFYKKDFEKFALLSMVVIFALRIVSRANRVVFDLA